MGLSLPCDLYNVFVHLAGFSTKCDSLELGDPDLFTTIFFVVKLRQRKWDKHYLYICNQDAFMQCLFFSIIQLLPSFISCSKQHEVLKET